MAFTSTFSIDGICTRTYHSLEHFENDMKYISNPTDTIRARFQDFISYDHGILVPYPKPSNDKKNLGSIVNRRGSRIRRVIIILETFCIRC